MTINRDLKHRQRNARRRPSQPKEEWVEGFVLVFLRRRRVLVLRLVALAMAFKNVRNLLLINHNDGFIDDDEFVVLYSLFASKNLDFPYDSYAQFDLEELDESESFAEFRCGKRDIRILKEVLQIPDMIDLYHAAAILSPRGTKSFVFARPASHWMRGSTGKIFCFSIV